MTRLLLIGALALFGCAGAGAPAGSEPWRPLFDGSSLQGWRVAGGASGQVEVAGTRLVLHPGEPMTLLALEPAVASAIPRDGYELELYAARTSGTDFFVGLTFPVGDGGLTLILGGWGGSLCGLSCLDGEDASANETKCFHRFDKGRDYRVSVRVLHGRVTARVDGEPIVDVDTSGRRCTLRHEVEACGPVGLATYQTEARVAGVRWRRVW